jgi:hypothetical protein
MMGRLKREQEQLFYSFCLDEAVPDDHAVRAIAAVLDLSWVHGEPPTANEVNRLRTERFENGRTINARVGFQSFPLPRDISAKCGGLRHEK